MTLNRRLAILGLMSLATCGRTPASAPPAAPGVLFAPDFDDADPVDFTGRAPQRYPVQGIDAARFQTGIDWNTARRNGVNFAFLKATEGGDLLDLEFENHWRGAGRAGVLRGAYHFYYFCTDPEVQARWFIQNVPRTRMMPPVLDMEWNPFSPTCTVRPPGEEVRAQMRVWLQIVGRHYGQTPIIYTTPDFYAVNDLDRVRGHEFWLRATAENVAKVYPGQPWRFWQYSMTGLIEGVDGKVDLNAFNGTREDWNAWVAARVR